MKEVQGLLNKVTTPEQRRKLKSMLAAGGEQAAKARKIISNLTKGALKGAINGINEINKQLGIQQGTNIQQAAEKAGKKLQSNPVYKAAEIITLPVGFAMNPAQSINKVKSLGSAATKGVQAAKQAAPKIAKYAASRIEQVKANPKAAELIDKFVSKVKYPDKPFIMSNIDELEVALGKRFPDKPYVNSSLKEFFAEAKSKGDDIVKKLSEGYGKTEEEVRKLLKDFNINPDEIGPLKGTFGGTNSLFEGANKEAILNKAASGQNLSVSEEATFIQELKENSAGIKQAFDVLGIKNKSEMADGIKFIKDFGKILENSPKNIKGKAFSKVKTLEGNFKIQNPESIEGLIADTGLTPKDIFKLWKDNKKTFIGGVFAAGIGSLVLGGLGYLDKGPLARKARKDAGLEDLPFDISGMSEQEKAEVKANLRDPRLSELTSDGVVQGISGKKYHIYNDSIYDFNTGAKINITQALEDISAFEENRAAKAQQEIAKNNETLRQLQMQQEAGYNVAPQIQQVQMQTQQLQQQVNQSQSTLSGIRTVTDVYSDDEDASEQYYRREIQPQINNQQLQRQQQQAMMQNMYSNAFNQIAQSTYADLDRYYTPENQAINYFKYMQEAATGNAPMLSPEQYTHQMKIQALHELAPTMRDKAISSIDNVMKNYYEGQKLEQNYAELEEKQRHNLAGEQTDVYKAGTDRMKLSETQRHNLSEEGLKSQSNQTDAFQAITGRMNAETAQQEYQRKQAYLPYQQAEALGGFFGNMSMSDVNPEQVMQDNPELFGSVLPHAGESKQQAQTPQQQNTQLFNKLKGQQ